jgi:hypothetical protein
MATGILESAEAHRLFVNRYYQQYLGGTGQCAGVAS